MRTARRSLLAAAVLASVATSARAEIILTPYYGTAFGGTTTKNSPTPPPKPGDP
jgi:hypothetical protein